MCKQHLAVFPHEVSSFKLEREKRIRNGLQSLRNPASLYNESGIFCLGAFVQALVMENQEGIDREDKSEVVRVIADPGICGFICSISAWKDGDGVRFNIRSDCDQIKELAMHLGPIKMKELFVPLTKSPVFLSAEKSKCHHACPIPSSLIKAAEVALGLALPKEVTIRFLT
jgi:hypothetical protein